MEFKTVVGTLGSVGRAVEVRYGRIPTWGPWDR